MKLHIELTKTETAAFKRILGGMYNNMSDVMDADGDSISETKKEFIDRVISTNEMTSNIGTFATKKDNGKFSADIDFKASFVTGMSTIFQNFISRIALTLRELIIFENKFM